MSKYNSFIPGRKTAVTPAPVNEPIVGREKEMVVNSAGSYTFQTGNWTQLDRFLILGAAGPTYYVSQKDLVTQNVDVIKACIKEDASRVVNRVVQISQAGRAPRNDPALFVLALVTAEGDAKAKSLAYASLHKVARIGTHILHFAQYANHLRGWGRGLKKAVSNWFDKKEASKLAMQVVKYKNRDGWSMRDLLRLSHPQAPTESHKAIYHWVAKGWESVGEYSPPDSALNVIWAAEKAKRSTDEREIARLVNDFSLPWEAIDTKWLNSPVVWESLLENITPEALMRNLNRLTSIGYLQPMSKACKKVVEILTNGDKIQQARLHPIKILVALNIYARGRGEKGSLTWTPVQNVVDALDDAHYLSYKYVEPSGKRYLLALDVSGSMDLNATSGFPLTPREIVAAMAMVTARVEQEHMFVGFSNSLVQIPISPRQRLDDVCRLMRSIPMGCTDVSLPFVWALKEKKQFDGVVVLTDNEVNAGVHPAQSFSRYKKEMGLDTKMVVVGTNSTGFTVADPNRDDNLDVVGFDTSCPQFISDFVAGRFDKKTISEM